MREDGTMGKRKPLPDDLTPSVDAIVAAFWTAEDDDVRDGMTWYARAHALAVELEPDAPQYAAGVIAALSPQTGWAYNVDLARRAYANDRASGHTGDAVSKANRILSHYGDPLDILGGQKVRAFYQAIAQPDHPTAVVIDRHAFDIAVGRVTDSATRGILARVGVYEMFADAYRAAAVVVSSQYGEHITPSALQAITWLAWRRSKGIVD